MSGPSHRFLGISSTLWEVSVPYSRIQHGDLSEDRTPDALPLGHTAPLLYHEVVYFFNIQLVCNMYRFVSSPEPWLICELIVYPWIRRPSYVVRRRRRPQCSKIFFSETAWPIKAKFYVEPPWVGGTKVCSRHLGHMTKMAATPIYGKNP